MGGDENTGKRGEPFLIPLSTPGMLSKLIPGVDRGMGKDSPSLVVFSSPPIGPHRP